MSNPVLEFDCTNLDDKFYRRPAIKLVEKLAKKYA